MSTPTLTGSASPWLTEEQHVESGVMNERARCLAVVRRVMDTTVNGSSAIYAVMKIAELIEAGE